MKVSVAKRTPETFTPVVLTITIETREELLDMYVRHILSNDCVVKLVNGADFGRDNSVTTSVGKPALMAACQSIPNSALDIPLLVALKEEILK